MNLFLLSLFFTTGAQWYKEDLHQKWGQTFQIDEVLYEEKTEHQHLLIFRNDLFGRVMALDGVIQNTEKDEFIYHEMLAHVPLLSHQNPREVLIIGGGDGGLLREVLKHPQVKKVTLVEIDSAVVEFSKKYLPYICQNAFEDPRLELLIQDGCRFVKETEKKFDIILCDSTDPEGPGKVLFTSEFYRDCHTLLAKDGIMANQNGVPFLQEREFVETFENRKAHFDYTSFFLAVVPTYAGGSMALGFASDNPTYPNISLDDLENRLKGVSGTLRYYTPAVHKAAFALPPFMKNHMEKGNIN